MTAKSPLLLAATWMRWFAGASRAAVILATAAAPRHGAVVVVPGGAPRTRAVGAAHRRSVR